AEDSSLNGRIILAWKIFVIYFVQDTKKFLEIIMKIQIEKRANRIIVYCSGRIDAENSQEFEKKIEPLINIEIPIILDFAGVNYIASAGIRSLLYLLKTARSLAAKNEIKTITLFRLVNIQKEVKKILDLVGLTKAFTEKIIPIEKPKIPEDKGKSYSELLTQVLNSFPTPISDPIKDAYFVQSISKGLNCLDKLKSKRPYLGERVVLDYDKARKQTVPEKMSTLEQTIEEVSDYMQGIVIWGHPHLQENVIPPSTIASIVGQLFASIYNPNIIWDEYSHKVSQAEVEVISMCADLIGYDQQKSSGVFTFGGTGTVLYGTKMGIEKASKDTFRKGIHEKMKIVASEASHYAKMSVSGWLGLGTDCIVSVPTDGDNSMDLENLESCLRKLLKQKEKIACIIATMGTTDAFGIDNLEYIIRLRDKLVDEYELSYQPHVHADAVIGWAWSFFNDYDFENNPLEFSERTLRSLWDTCVNVRTLSLADSLGIDFHKTGYGPYVSSLFLCKDKEDLNLITRDKKAMPYLFQFGNYHPGIFTLETSRSGGAVLSALANFLLLGKEGYRTILGQTVSMAEYLRSKLEEVPYACPINTYNYGQVVLFRIYPDEYNASQTYMEEINNPDKAKQLEIHNQYNRKIFDVLHKQMESGEGIALSLTDCYRHTSYGKPILAIKSFVMSPFTNEKAMNFLMKCIEKARKEIK
ncbi:MAG: anti-sigma factor antagonist, partial [Candidatus Cloacimonetes bacterium]|nr:anti-sigma factor antagonist [Candidatus Cloacimonadota bacterium]